MNSPIVDTSLLDDESGVIPEVDSWEKNCEPIPKSNDFKYGVNYMNQLVNVSKVDYFLASTIDDSVCEDSMAESRSNKSTVSRGKSKGRATSGISHLKKKRGLAGTKNADLICEDEPYMSGTNKRKNLHKNKKRNDSTSPFPQHNTKNKRKNLRKDEKSTDIDEDSKRWGLAGRAIDKKNSTKITHDTTSENGENSWIKSRGNISSNEKGKKSTKYSRENSRVRLKKNSQKLSKKTKTNKKMEEEKVHGEIDVQDSYSYKFEVSNSSPQKKAEAGKAKDYEKELNKTETVMNQNRKKMVPHSNPNSGAKKTAMHFHEQKFGESSGKVGFEDSLISGTRIDIPGQKGSNKKKILQDKRKKIEQIQKKYDGEKKPQEQRRTTRGYSYQEPGRSKMSKSKNKSKNEKIEPGVKSSKITAHKRNAFKNKKGSEMLPQDKHNFKSQKDKDEEIKMSTQTFRFTNQFKSDIDIDGEMIDDEEVGYEEEIAEEIETKSDGSGRDGGRNNRLKRNNGPIDVPSDTNPFKKKRASKHPESSSSNIGTPINRPPKVPNPKISSKIALASPAHQIFTTKRQKKEIEQNDGVEALEKRYSEPPKPLDNLLAKKNTQDEISRDNYLDIGLSNDQIGASSASQVNPDRRTEMRKLLDKMRSAYTKETLLQTPVEQHSNFN